MAHDRTHARGDIAEHEATYRGFLMLLKVSLAVSAVTLSLLYFFLAR